MRKDMPKKFSEVRDAENKKWYSKKKKPNIRPVDYYNDETDYDKQEKIKKHGYSNPTCTPLFNWVESKIGEKWDDVYSELCEVFHKDEDWWGRRFVKEYVVNLDTFYENGKRFRRNYSIFGGIQELQSKELYVDDKGYLRRYWRY